ncbi:hypothetical protein GCM10009584_04560 [Ornithinimicrobium humiphilum]|uniref:Uncharacterized protein n=1 Tax=Ornithinimicrobium humiphilum TaxID=125288 RepID=A0A543K817_9MICO|nr:hypothetical protein [Ornithinimicrobium humiphilum]TQM91184.1 hypothetical protein FB476_2916 [Ornithinimicrobium humiphilum]
MSIVPGQDPVPQSEPLLADEPLPPGVEDWSDDVDALEQRIRQRGPSEVERADEQADAVEGEGGAQPQESVGEGGDGSGADASSDPTSDEGADAEDPEAQSGDEPSGDAQD